MPEMYCLKNLDHKKNSKKNRKSEQVILIALAAKICKQRESLAHLGISNAREYRIINGNEKLGQLQNR
jgi:hypothetical protein